MRRRTGVSRGINQSTILSRSSDLLASCILGLVLVDIHLSTRAVNPTGTSPADLACCYDRQWAGERAVGTTADAVRHTVISPVGRKATANTTAVTCGLLASIVAISVARKRRRNPRGGVETCPLGTCEAKTRPR